MKGVFWELHEAVGGGDVAKVLASTTKAYSRRAYGEKAWKAAAEYLVKKYGAEKAVKIMHHKAMRTAHDQADKRDVRGIVASVDSTVLSWPVKDILADIGDSVGLAEADNSNLKGATARKFFAVNLHKIAVAVDATINDQGDFIALIVDGENAKEAVKKFKEVGVWKFLLDKDKQAKRAEDGTYPIVFEFDLSKIK